MKPRWYGLLQHLAGLTAALAFASAAWAGSPAAATWIGRPAPDFSLPSQQQRLVNYARDYYGKHHLILTFFPAAFTPV